jgi:hypothetical protein
LKYVKSVKSYPYGSVNGISRITQGNIYKVEKISGDWIYVTDDLGDYDGWHKHFFEDFTRKMKLKRILKDEV